jgi:hypothetical protein
MLTVLGLLLAGFVRWRIRLATMCRPALMSRRRRGQRPSGITSGCDTSAENGPAE